MSPQLNQTKSVIAHSLVESTAIPFHLHLLFYKPKITLVVCLDHCISDIKCSCQNICVSWFLAICFRGEKGVSLCGLCRELQMVVVGLLVLFSLFGLVIVLLISKPLVNFLFFTSDCWVYDICGCISLNVTPLILSLVLYYEMNLWTHYLI